MTYWDTQANRWGVFSVPDEDYDKYTARQVAFIVEQLDVGDDGLLIDVGCGIGRLTTPIAEAIPGAMVFGVDPSVEMRAIACSTRPRIAGYRINLESFFHETVHGAWCVLVFQHLDEAPIREILRDVAGVLKPGGRFVSQWMLDKDQAFPREADVLRVLEEEGFETVRHVDDSTVTRLWFADNWLWVTSERVL